MEIGEGSSSEGSTKDYDESTVVWKGPVGSIPKGSSNAVLCIVILSVFFCIVCHHGKAVLEWPDNNQSYTISST